jgi:sugar phosphate isomerase/epimerase
MKFGICCGPQSLPVEGGSVRDSVLNLMNALQHAGADYAEFGVAHTMGEEEQFAEIERAVQESPLRVEAFNSFVPATHRITGPNVDRGAALEYCRKALGRCKRLGGDVVVLGSAGARKVPEGFDHAQAAQQFEEFCRELGPIAEQVGIMIAIEPLNKREDNLVLSVAQGAQIVDAVGHPYIQLLADLYHMTEDAERIENIGDAGEKIRHTHVADLGRVAPGSASDGEANFRGFFSELRRAGYDRLPNARCSFEGVFSNLGDEIGPLLAHLRTRWNETS